FTGGNGYLCLKGMSSKGGGCDSGHQAIPPVAALGYRYVGIPYTTRRADLQPESIIYRIVGAVAGTSLTFDPPVPGAPTTLDVGQMVDFEATGPFVVSSQDEDHPFYLGQMMTGCFVHGGSRPGINPASLSAEYNCLGDEEYVNILPPAQFLSRYIFFTDPTYGTTNLVLTRVKTPSGFKEVSVGCSGVVSGWQPVGSSGEFEIANVDLVRSAHGVAGCTNGPQSAQSDGPFGLMVWGLDSFASYAYPAGGNIAPINTVVVPAVPK
ncbi:MAG TPA: IgGFc-binding protein, partial [Polyangiaceae bacterium]|nr:IgGFc-binding protein [Polyangiaceae bacterium]